MSAGSTPQPGTAGTPAAGARPRRSRRETIRLVAVGTLAVLATLFAVFNLDQVKVNLLFTTQELPLIVVIVVCLLVGAIFGAVLDRRSRRRH
jgi:uncharacterized integral membrane protein